MAEVIGIIMIVHISHNVVLIIMLYDLFLLCISKH